MLSLSSASVVMWCVIGPFNARACNKSLCGKPVTYIYIINNGTSYKNVESFVPNVKQVLFLNGSVVLLFCCFLKTCFSRKRLDALRRREAAAEPPVTFKRSYLHLTLLVLRPCEP